MTPTEPETIERAAIRRYSAVWSVPRPGRHHDVIAFMAEQGVDTLGEYTAQGFTTSTGRFVDREEAMKIAKAAGQLIAATTDADGIEVRREPGKKLFSEDVW